MLEIQQSLYDNSSGKQKYFMRAAFYRGVTIKYPVHQAIRNFENSLRQKIRQKSQSPKETIFSRNLKMVAPKL